MSAMVDYGDHYAAFDPSITSLNQLARVQSSSMSYVPDIERARRYAHFFFKAPIAAPRVTRPCQGWPGSR